MRRQRSEVRAFVLESLGRNETGLALGALFHPLGGPLESLFIEIFQALEGAPRKEIRFHRPKTSLFTGFAVRCELHPIRTMAKSISG